MFNSMKILSVFVLLLIIPSLSEAKWVIHKDIKNINTEKNIFKIVTNGADTGIVVAYFILKNNIDNVFDKKYPLYTIDSNDVHDLSDKKIYKLKKNRYIKWEISQKKDVLSEDLQELMKGESITFQYYLPNGIIKETTFNLNGIREAVNEIIR